LESVLPTDTASGAIASFPDGSDLFDYLSCVTQINPVQDLHGYDKPWVGSAGANKWDEEWEVSGSRINSKNLIPVLPNMEYAWVSPAQPSNGLRFYDADKNLISTVYTVNNGKFTTPVDCFYIWFALASNYGTTYNHDIAINYPSTVTTYSPYSNICPITGWTGCEVVVSPTQDAQDGTTYPVSWQTEAGTVYGGTVDLVTGVLTAYPYYTSYNGETLVGPWVSSMDEYIEGRIPTTGAQVVDLGGTPTTYQLTPTQIHALLGQNNVWADCGDVEVQYKADVQRWVEKKLGQ
jgi:hypothetical protein